MRATRKQRVSLADWLYWFQPGERQWFWWAASAENADTASLEVEVQGWPVALGALEWLLRASGALEVAPFSELT